LINIIFIIYFSKILYQIYEYTDFQLAGY